MWATLDAIWWPNVVLWTRLIGPHHDTYEVVVSVVGEMMHEPVDFLLYLSNPNDIWSAAPDDDDVDNARYVEVAE